MDKVTIVASDGTAKLQASSEDRRFILTCTSDKDEVWVYKLDPPEVAKFMTAMRQYMAETP